MRDRVQHLALTRASGELGVPLSKRTAQVKAWIEAKPGAEGRVFAPGKNSLPLVVIYKVMGKTFAILSVRGIEDVLLKCDPLLASALRKDYTGVGHRSHLDRRFWISVRLDADVPAKEIGHLVSLSYELVCANLTAKQRTELARLAPSASASRQALEPERSLDDGRTLPRGNGRVNLIDEYLAKVEPAKRKALERIRALAKKTVPDADETISYGMPTLKYQGKPFLGFDAHANHIGVYPYSGHVIETLGEKLRAYKTTKGAIRVPLDMPIPERTLRAVIECRLEAIRAGKKA